MLKVILIIDIESVCSMCDTDHANVITVVSVMEDVIYQSQQISVQVLLQLFDVSAPLHAH